ncbi:hypothetical protein SARC_02182 [Sphaeroforma arctica JP610]|uniref:Uncharacterized protein n=1 Tax=Sphaeroforma arctica JP610 TaxID=667725 RepID=A0A0L0G9W1_9EUKA|nr:hypothetical protein SARC_02182 [Sphaeroforma arctica JP610]KNC85661.1 hypothetical protein SARC_02182 [Sphaeroforma arctica JP610]|eukprot:XP_014159563.1 hypothetical protein SARC_02182 [Sphaeroforma arctica JP610]
MTITDNANGFNQCFIREENRDKTTSITSTGQFYERIDIGLGLFVVHVQYTTHNEFNFRDVQGVVSLVDDGTTATRLPDGDPLVSGKEKKADRAHCSR